MENKKTPRKPMKILGTALDCSDAKELAAFYVRLLGWEMTYSSEDVAVISSPEHPSQLVFQVVEEYQKPVWPWEKEKQAQMMHFDFFVEDLEQAVEHAKACGATLSPVQFFQETSRTMFDPAGHPFCLSTCYEAELYAK